jgi:hypothetical protein
MKCYSRDIAADWAVARNQLRLTAVPNQPRFAEVAVAPPTSARHQVDVEGQSASAVAEGDRLGGGDAS